MIGAHTARALVDLGHEVVVTAHRRTEVPPFLAGRVTVAPLDVTERDALLALGDRHAISDIVHLAGSVPGKDPVAYLRADLTGLLNALDAARTWGARRFAVAGSLGVYIGWTEIPWHEDLALTTAVPSHPIVAFKKAVEPLNTHSLPGSGVEPVVLRIGTIWGPLVDPESPFFHIPSYVSAVLRGEQPPALHADDGGDCCYAPDAGRAIALLMTAGTLRHDTYNVSRGRPFTHREFAEALAAVIPGLRLDLLPGRQHGPGSGDDPYLDITRLARDTGFAPAFDIPTRSPTLSRDVPTLPAEGAQTLSTTTCAAYSTAPRSPTSPPSSPTARPTPHRSGSVPTVTRLSSSPVRARVKRNLRRDPRTALSIAPVDNPFEPVIIRGRVVEWVEGDAALEIIDRLSTKYTGAPYPREHERVVVVIEPERQTVGIG